MKKFELAFTTLQVPIDYLMLILAGFTAYALRFSAFVRGIRPVLFQINLGWNTYWPIVVWAALGWLVIFALSGLYRVNPNRKLAPDMTRIFMACSTGFAAITIYVFVTLQKFDSRFLVFASWILAMVYVFFGRLIMRGIKALLYRLGIGLRRTIIIGQKSVAETIKRTLMSEPRLGYVVVATLPHFSFADSIHLVDLHADEIIFTDPKTNEAETLAAIDFANDHHITFKYSADLFATISTNMAVSTIAGIPIIELRRTRLSGWGRVFKRLIDIVGSLFLLIICIPLYLLVSLIILIETGHPVIYKNERVGHYGKKFFTLKFRSMYQKFSTGPQFGQQGEVALKLEQELIKKQNSKTGPVYKVKNDPRITPFGRFIRRWSLDELPQFWNVLKGEMSLVGPRPHQPREVEKYQKEHKILLAIKPGITGLAQISGRSDLTFEEEARLDTFYIENWNWLLDIIILIKTPFIVLSKKGSIV